MTANRGPGGGDLFIVDNSIPDWKGLDYLREWAEVARSFDIGTSFFEIGSLLAMDGRWQQLEKVRILMGDEVSLKTRQAFGKALNNRIGLIDNNLEEEKHANPFLHGAEAVVEAIQSGQIECRVYRKKKFHAKVYITHSRFDVGAQALVGSSNFTKPGLTRNVELNIQIQSEREVAQLQDWFESHWVEAEPVTEEVLQVVKRHIRRYQPFEVYAKALHEYFRGHVPTAGEWEQHRSKMFHQLDRYQQEAYWSLMKIARRYGGAFLCDGVGLGKTFVGLMLIERLVSLENKKVVVFAPKAAREGVWELHLREWLPDIGGTGGGRDFSSLALFNHTDLTRKGDFPERFKNITCQADAVIIDEAHHFRNPGRQAKPEDEEDRRSRYWRLFDLLDGEAKPKLLFLLTATPINNRLADFRHMAELFTRRDDSYFARTLGVDNFTGRFNHLEKQLRPSLGSVEVLQEGLPEDARDVLSVDEIFSALVVQRSRSYAKASQEQEHGKAAAFPVRDKPQVADYSIRRSYGEALDIFQQAFQRENPLFTLAIYYPLAYYTGSDEDINPLEQNRQKQVVGLIRTLFLKRFESSVWAFERSLDRLMRKLLAFVEVHSESPTEQYRYQRWISNNADVVAYRPAEQLDLDLDEGSEAEEADLDEDIVPPELLENVTELSRRDYDVTRILSETYSDLDQIADFLAFARQFGPHQDDKLRKLIRLLRSKEMEGRKVLVFTEFADTARYLFTHLKEAGIKGLAQLDSNTKEDRAEIIRRFSPYYNGSSSTDLARDGKEEIRVLISTDVLSEGLNLQDATRLINYDIHWNPVRLMQRIGRVDRRMSPDIEKRLIADHPETERDRGKVAFWNFLPPDELNDILSLYEKVTQKLLLISTTFGIEGRNLLTPEDELKALREFNASYEGKKSHAEELHLEYQQLLKQHPELAKELDLMPGSVFSGRKRLKRGARGVFFCFSLPALDQERKEFTLEAGLTRWYLYDLDQDEIIESAGQIVDSIRSKPNTPRRCVTAVITLKEIRKKVQDHIHNTYLKQVQVPANAPKPKLRCWMELNG
ncbi:MAG: helicase-related protein [bacterium]|nr:helicase-related protein [bacterium]